MYPTLYRLEDKGYITVTKQQVGRRRTRMYYHLEPSGGTICKAVLQNTFPCRKGFAVSWHPVE